MYIKYRYISFLSIGLLLTATLLFTNDFSRINLFGRITTPFVISVFLFLGVSILIFKKWEKLRPVTILLLVSYFFISVTGLISTLIINFKGDLINSEGVFTNLWNGALYGPVLLFFLVQHLKKYKFKKDYLNMWVNLTIIVIIIGVFQILAIQGVNPFNKWFLWENIRGDGTRIASTFTWQGPFVLFLGIILPVIAALLMTSRGFIKSFLYGVIFLGGISSILYSGSRTGLFMIPLSLIPIIIAFPKRVLKSSLIAILFSILALNIISTDSLAVNRALNLEGISSDARVGIIYSGIKLWKESPIVGIGPLQLYEYIGFAPHNSYLESLVEGGIMTAIPFLIFIISILLIAIRLLKYKSLSKDWLLRVGISFGLVNFLIYNFSASAINYSYIVLFLAMAISYYEDEQNDITFN